MRRSSPSLWLLPFLYEHVPSRSHGLGRAPFEWSRVRAANGPANDALVNRVGPLSGKKKKKKNRNAFFFSCGLSPSSASRDYAVGVTIVLFFAPFCRRSSSSLVLCALLLSMALFVRVPGILRVTWYGPVCSSRVSCRRPPFLGSFVSRFQVSGSSTVPRGPLWFRETVRSAGRTRYAGRVCGIACHRPPAHAAAVAYDQTSL